jgi:hypothetical protein
MDLAARIVVNRSSIEEVRSLCNLKRMLALAGWLVFICTHSMLMYVPANKNRACTSCLQFWPNFRSVG